MNNRRILVISERPEDLRFAQTLAQRVGCRVGVVENWQALVAPLAQGEDCILLWDVDGAYSADDMSALSRVEVNATLKGKCDPERVIALSDKPLGQFSVLPEKKEGQLIFLRQNILRRFTDSAIDLFSALGEQVFEKDVKPFKSYFPDDTKIQKVTIKKSDHRHAAANAVQSVLTKLGIDDRIAAKISQATDELLMNAIFDAARSKDGKPIRQMMSRSLKFDLQPMEQVDLEVAFTKDYIGIAVTDTFGSLDQEVLSRYLTQNYTDEDYRVRKYNPGAGLGLYGILNSGVSLFMACHREKRTMATLFFPNEPSFKQFKKGFQFSMSVFRPITRKIF